MLQFLSQRLTTHSRNITMLYIMSQISHHRFDFCTIHTGKSHHRFLWWKTPYYKNQPCCDFYFRKTVYKRRKTVDKALISDTFAYIKHAIHKINFSIHCSAGRFCWHRYGATAIKKAVSQKALYRPLSIGPLYINLVTTTPHIGLTTRGVYISISVHYSDCSAVNNRTTDIHV